MGGPPRAGLEVTGVSAFPATLPGVWAASDDVSALRHVPLAAEGCFEGIVRQFVEHIISTQ